MTAAVKGQIIKEDVLVRKRAMRKFWNYVEDRWGKRSVFPGNIDDIAFDAYLARYLNEEEMHIITKLKKS